MIINCIAVDDEPLALDILKEYIEKIPYLELKGSFTSGMKCIEFLKQNKIDLLFLDIQMEELTGIQLLHVLKEKPEVIFTTAYDKYALQGFELDVADYLLKPISFERFVKAVDKVYEKIALQHLPAAMQKDTAAGGAEQEFIFVKTEFRLQKVFINDILYIESKGDYQRIVTAKEKIMTLQNFKKLESVLPETRFFRVHRSYMVAIDKIISIERNRIKIADQMIPIGDNYRKPFFALIESKGLMG
jgi:two-component system, LytTR family, response regulator